MISLENKYGPVQIPESWSECTGEQYVAIAGVLMELIGGKLDLTEFRLRCLQALTGYARSRKRFTLEQQDRINENLFLLADRIHFPIRPVYTDQEVLQVLSPELQQKLKTHFPFEVYDERFQDELKMVEKMLQYRAGLNIILKRNPLLQISHAGKDLFGPRFEVDHHNLAVTDIMAGEFVDGYEYYRLYQATGEEAYLRKLCFTLYREDRSKYDGSEAHRTGPELPGSVMFGIFLLFQSVMEYLMGSPYKVLFGRKEAGGQLTVGMVGTLYGLSQQGYGTKEEVSRLNLADYLNMILKQLIDAVQSMRAYKKSNTEIARELEIPIETVMQI